MIAIVAYLRNTPFLALANKHHIYAALREVELTDSLETPGYVVALRKVSLTSPPPAHEACVTLSRREREIVGLILLGKTNKEIACHLYLGSETIKTHVSRILKKLGARNRTEVAYRAKDHLRHDVRYPLPADFSPLGIAAETGPDYEDAYISSTVTRIPIKPKRR